MVAQALAAWGAQGVAAMPAFLALPLVVLFAGLLVLNVLGHALIAVDKARARSGCRRVPERVLWLLALCGAWPGMAIAISRHRHKTRKVRFLVPFWLAACAGTALLGLAAWWSV